MDNSRRPSHVDLAGPGERIYIPGVGKRLQLIQPAESLRLQARLAGITVRDDGVNFDAHNAPGTVNPLCDSNSFADERHRSPIEEVYRHQLCGVVGDD